MTTECIGDERINLNSLDYYDTTELYILSLNNS
jgi:hypothetical protein